MGKYRYYYPQGGTEGLNYEVGELLKFKRGIYKIIKVTPKYVKLEFIRKPKAGVD